MSTYLLPQQPSVKVMMTAAERVALPRRLGRGSPEPVCTTSMVGIPAGVADAPNAREFSGAIDFSGFLKKTGANYDMQAGDASTRINAEKAVAINDKLLGFGLQCHGYAAYIYLSTVFAKNLAN